MRINTFVVAVLLSSLVGCGGNVRAEGAGYVEPNSGNYSRLDFEDFEGNDMFTIASHRRTNPKVINGVLGTYRHDHSSFYTATESSGMEHAIDITHGEPKGTNQIHVQLPMIFKSHEAELILRTANGKYVKIVVSDEDYSIRAVPIDHDYVIKANKDFQPE